MASSYLYKVTTNPISLTSISQIPQVLSGTIAFAVPVLFAYKTHTSTFCIARSFSFCRSQLKWHLPRDASLTIQDIPTLYMVTLYYISFHSTHHDLYMAYSFVFYFFLANVHSMEIGVCLFYYISLGSSTMSGTR